MMFKYLIKLRNKVSMLLGLAYKKTKWEPYIPADLSALRHFIDTYYLWQSELVDHIQPVEHMNWQLKNKDVIEGDCDDFATYTAYMLKRMGYKEIYRVNIPAHKHVICVFFGNINLNGVFGYTWCSNKRIGTMAHKTWQSAAEMWCILRGLSKDVQFIEERI